MPENANEKENVKVQKAETLSSQAIMTKLAQAGFRYSRSRWILAEYIACKGAEGVDFTIDGLWHEVSVHHSTIGRMTVFRLVDVLVKVKVGGYACPFLSGSSYHSFWLLSFWCSLECYSL
jgi:hypothetical protein